MHVKGLRNGLLVTMALMCAGAAAERPNVVFVLVDDLGWADLGCAGSDFYETPNMDQLAADGMRFTDAYASSPVCLPTRASLMTGNYPQRYGLTWVHHGTNNRVRKVLPPSKHRLPLEATTIAEELRKEGYANFFAGKWHLSDDSALEPEFQGFDINVAGHDWGLPSSYWYPYKNPENPRNDVPDLEDGQEGDYLTDVLTDKAVAFIEENRGKPFFVYLSHYAVHAPLMGKKELVDKYRAKMAKYKGTLKKSGRLPVYAAMIESVDEGVGSIMQKLRDCGLEENTMIIFTSDNGGFMDNAPMRGIKGHTTEGGIRVPLIVKWPCRIKAGMLSDYPVSSIDYFPTLRAAAGISGEAPADGVNLLPLLEGESALPVRPLFWHTPHYHQIYKGVPAGAIRLGDYKLIWYYENDEFELYNVAEDIGEKHDLAAAMPEKVSDLRKRFDDWSRDVGALFPSEP